MFVFDRHVYTDLLAVALPPPIVLTSGGPTRAKFSIPATPYNAAAFVLTHVASSTGISASLPSILTLAHGAPGARPSLLPSPKNSDHTLGTSVALLRWLAT